MTIMDMSVNDMCSQKNTAKNHARKPWHFAIDVLYKVYMILHIWQEDILVIYVFIILPGGAKHITYHTLR